MCPRAAGASMVIGSRPFLAHHPQVKRASTRVGLRFVEIGFSWDCTKPSRIHMDARSAKLSSGCKDSPTNAFNEALDIYQVRPRKDKRGVDLISDALPFGRLWAVLCSRSENSNRIRPIGRS